MTIFNRDGKITFSFFSKFPNLTVFMSSRKLGNLDMKKAKDLSVDKFLNSCHVNRDMLVTMEQVHGIKIKRVSKAQGGNVILGVDGLVTSDINLFLGVKTADCIPLFFYAPKKNIIGIAHAGWKGTFDKISQYMIKEFLNSGVQISDIYIFIGPSIHSCCYSVDQDRADSFLKTFPTKNIISKKKNKYYLDLGSANLYSLVKTGIPENHIELSSACTSCMNQIYFSFRKDHKENTGRILSIIGLKRGN